MTDLQASVNHSQDRQGAVGDGAGEMELLGIVVFPSIALHY